MRVVARSATVFVSVLVGCGSSGTPDDAGGLHPRVDGGALPGQPDAGPGGGGGPDAGSGNGYPAPHLAPALQVYGGDRLLLHPKIVTVTFPGESQAATFEAFGDAITATPWWDAVTRGYCDGAHACIGRGAGGGHVRLSSSPSTTYTDSPNPSDPSTIKELIRNRVADHTFPAPDDDTLYVMYFPSSVSISLKNGTQNATSCVQFGGYHTFAPVTSPATGATVKVAYAIVPQCSVLTGLNTIEDASHEIIEAATDPLVSDTTANGYYMDQTRDAWLAVTAAETADVCALLRYVGGSLSTLNAESYSESGYTVQRSFSNASLLEGHDFCVPARAGAYFNVAPEVEKLVMHTGDTRTIELTGFSDGPTADWSVQAKDFGKLVNPFGTAVLGLSLDRSTANNGTKLHLTIKVNGTVDPVMGASFVIVSTSGSQVTFWPGIVETQ